MIFGLSSLNKSFVAAAQLFLMRPFITEKYTFGSATGNSCFYCTGSDIAAV